MMSDFDVGDIVRLKTSSRLMVVKRVFFHDVAAVMGDELGIHCSMIDDFGRPHEAVYFPEQLEKTTEKSSEMTVRKPTIYREYGKMAWDWT